MKIEDWIRHLERLGQPEPARLPPEKTLLHGDRGEQVLWRACAGEAVDMSRIMSRIMNPIMGRTLAAEPGAEPDGPLLPTDAYLAIEVWAECELSALHALHRLVRERHPALPASAQRRAGSAVRWHLEHTQPDNATNRPWALHVFLLASEGAGIEGVDPGDARFYAETLLHNMSATDARNEPLSRWILADAARELRLALGAT
jgi:hypothetical protein